MKKFVQTSILLFLLLWSITISAQGSFGGTIDGPYQIGCNNSATYTFSAGVQVWCSEVKWTVQFPNGSSATYTTTGHTISIPTGSTQGWLVVLAAAKKCTDKKEYQAGIQTYVGGALNPPNSLDGPSDLCNSSTGSYTGSYTASSVDNAGSYTFFVPSGWRINGVLTTSLTTTSTTVSITAPSSGSGTAEIRVRANPFSFSCFSSSSETTTTVNYGVQWPEITASSTVLGTNSFGNFYYDGFNISNIQWTIPNGWSANNLNGSQLTVITGSTPGNYVVQVSAQTCGSTVGDLIEVTVSGSGGFLWGNSREDSQITTAPNSTRKIALGEDITLYPNPVSNELFLSTANKDISLASVSIINLSDGKRVLFKTVNNDNSIIDLSNVMIGSYVVNMITSSGEQIQKKIQVIR